MPGRSRGAVKQLKEEGQDSAYHSSGAFHFG